MKRILGVFILITSLVYGEGLLFWNENSEEKAQIEAKKQEMALRWKKIKELDKKISFDKNKENLEKNYKKYVEEFNIYLEYIKQEAMKRLGMAEPQTYQIVYIDVPKQSYTVQYAADENEKEEPSFFASILNFLKKD